MICAARFESPWRFWTAPASPSKRALFRRTPEQKVLELQVGSEVLPVQLRRHRRARRFTLQVNATRREAVLTLPLRGTLAEARSFAERHGVWLAERLKELPHASPFVDGTLVPLRGEMHRIVHRKVARGTAWIETPPDGEKLLCVAGGEAHIARRVQDFLKREARRDFTDAVARHAATLNVRYARISVRDTSSRWGSCSSTGTLSFSWRLIFAPPYVLDYLAAHEVAHIVEMNHSRRFWRVVFSICADVRAAKDWLSAHGGELHRYGVE
jgi:predicted metal-dependent hydrolase